MHPDVDAVKWLLARLRRKVRSAWAARGMFLLAATAGLAVAASFALDYTLDLPRPVRAVHLLLVLGGLVTMARFVLLRPLSIRLDDQDLVQAVEEGDPGLGDRLASALDFSRRMADPEERESRELMARVVHEAEDLAARVQAGRLVDRRPVVRAGLLAAGGCALLAGTIVALPGAFGLWLQRGVLLAEVDWPRRTDVRVLDMPTDAPLVITRGDDLRVIAAVDGVRPASLELHYEELADPAEDADPDDPPTIRVTDVRKMYPVDGDDALYAFEFRAVAASFRFWVTGGDDQDRKPMYAVRALVPPRISSITATIHHPEYTGLPDRVAREPHLEVLTGSTVTLELGSNMPLASATLLPSDGAEEPLALDGAADRIRLEFEVRTPLEFHVRLTGRAGQVNRPEDDLFTIQPVEDRAPDVRVLYPLDRLYRTPNGIVPLKTVVSDDFGVAAVEVEVLREGVAVAPFPLWPPTDRPGALTREVDAYQPVDLQEFQGDGSNPVQAGDVLRLVVRARDNNDSERASPEITVDVIEPDAMDRRLGQRQVALREDLAQVRRSHRRVLQGIRALLGQAAAGNLQPAAVDRGRDLQVDQGRVGNDLAQFLSGIHQVFDAYVLNRMGSLPTIDRLLPLYHEFLQRPADPGDLVFAGGLYRRVVEEKRAGKLYDPEIIGTLLEIMDVGDLCVTDVSPAVFDALSRWSSAGTPADADLEEAERRAVDLEAHLAEIERRMERWEDLLEIIERIRELRDIQEDSTRPAPVPAEDRESDR